MEHILSPAPPGAVAVAERRTGAPASIGLCAAWSRHAAELAVPLGGELQHWAETPSTFVMVSDGELERLLPGRFFPPDLLGTAVRRALALGCALGARLQSHHVIAGPSAAWVLLGGTPPSPAELISPAHRGELAGVVLRTSRLAADEVETIGGAPVTIPARTGTDLLRFTPAWIAEPLLRGLVDSGHVEVDDIRRRLDAMHRHPGVQSARERLAAMLAVSGR